MRIQRFDAIVVDASHAGRAIAARTDLCGGRVAISVRTATSACDTIGQTCHGSRWHPAAVARSSTAPTGRVNDVLGSALPT